MPFGQRVLSSATCLLLWVLLKAAAPLWGLPVGPGDTDSWLPLIALLLTYLVSLRSSGCYFFGAAFLFCKIIQWCLIASCDVGVWLPCGGWSAGRELEECGARGLFHSYLPLQLWVSYRNPTLAQLAVGWRCSWAVCRESQFKLYCREISCTWHGGCAVQVPVSKWEIFSVGYKAKPLTKQPLHYRAGGGGCFCCDSKQLRNSLYIWTCAFF